jgi:hypothetical protein
MISTEPFNTFFLTLDSSHFRLRNVVRIGAHSYRCLPGKSGIQDIAELLRFFFIFIRIIVESIGK